MNIFLVSYTLIPAGVLTGMGEATMWPVMGLFVVHYARSYARHAKQSTDSYITQFFGIFYAVFQFSGVSICNIAYLEKLAVKLRLIHKKKTDEPKIFLDVSKQSYPDEILLQKTCYAEGNTLKKSIYINLQ